MDNEQAKLILSAYRPGGEDAADPVFSEALALARQDPDLDAWFAGQRRFDEAVRAALLSSAPPAGLRERLIVTNRIVQFGHQAPPVRPVWRHPAFWMALAAALVLVFGAAALLRPVEAVALPADTLVQKVLDLKQQGKITLGKMGGDLPGLRAWLVEHGSPSSFAVPEDLEHLRSKGCQVYKIDGRTVSQLCFFLDKDRLVHFFVTESAAGENVGPPRFVQRDRITAATWTANGLTYVLLGKDVDEETLRRLI